MDRYEFSASTRFHKLFTGIAMERPKSLPNSTHGCEDIGVELDADYGRLLERAYRNATNDYGKGMAAPAGLIPYSKSSDNNGKGVASPSTASVVSQK